MNIIRNKKLEGHNEEDNVFKQRLKTTYFMCIGGNFKTLTGKRNTQVYICSMCKFTHKKNRYEKIFDPHIKM